MNAYYNEHDPFAAAWLRNLISAGLIPAGDVDDRDIQLVKPEDLAGYVQCHFFAGIGGWAYALQLAGWPADRPVWTGSCPCQPYSAAGKGEGADDARNLWPHWFRLIRECRPPVVFGEQVEAAIRHGWLDAVSTDVEAEGYAFGACVLGAHSVGAPHIRQRVFFVADAGRSVVRSVGPALGGEARGSEGEGHQRERLRPDARDGGDVGTVADAWSSGTGSEAEHRLAETITEGSAGRTRGRGGDARAVAHSGSSERWPLTEGRRDEQHWHDAGRAEAAGGHRMDSPWADLVWLPCRDGKARPTKPGLFPLAHGVPNRVGTLRGAGNAINPYTAAEFIAAWSEVTSLPEPGKCPEAEARKELE